MRFCTTLTAFDVYPTQSVSSAPKLRQRPAIFPVQHVLTSRFGSATLLFCTFECLFFSTSAGHLFCTVISLPSSNPTTCHHSLFHDVASHNMSSPRLKLHEIVSFLSARVMSVLNELTASQVTSFYRSAVPAHALHLTASDNGHATRCVCDFCKVLPRCGCGRAGGDFSCGPPGDVASSIYMSESATLTLVGRSCRGVLARGTSRHCANSWVTVLESTMGTKHSATWSPKYVRRWTTKPLRTVD